MTIKSVIICLVLLLTALQYKLWFAPGNISDVRHMQAKITDQEKFNHQLTQRNQQLRTQLHRFNESDELLEEYARSEMGMIREDEIFYHVIEKKK